MQVGSYIVWVGKEQNATLGSLYTFDEFYGVQFYVVFPKNRFEIKSNIDLKTESCIYGQFKIYHYIDNGYDMKATDYSGRICWDFWYRCIFFFSVVGAFGYLRNFWVNQPWYPAGQSTVFMIVPLLLWWTFLISSQEM